MRSAQAQVNIQDREQAQGREPAQVQIRPVQALVQIRLEQVQLPVLSQVLTHILVLKQSQKKNEPVQVQAKDYYPAS
jgi:hypothetical protein